MVSGKSVDAITGSGAGNDMAEELLTLCESTLTKSNDVVGDITHSH
ncbi:hypothetical protein JMUB7504_27540 [Staphylococcus aureus]